jgi:hypothetical protein
MIDVNILLLLPGYNNFAAANAAGADITLADNKCDAEILKLM